MRIRTDLSILITPKLKFEYSPRNLLTQINRQAGRWQEPQDSPTSAYLQSGHSTTPKTDEIWVRGPLLTGPNWTNQVTIFALFPNGINHFPG